MWRDVQDRAICLCIPLSLLSSATPLAFTASLLQPFSSLQSHFCVNTTRKFLPFLKDARLTLQATFRRPRSRNTAPIAYKVLTKISYFQVEENDRNPLYSLTEGRTTAWDQELPKVGLSVRNDPRGLEQTAGLGFSKIFLVLFVGDGKVQERFLNSRVPAG